MAAEMEMPPDRMGDGSGDGAAAETPILIAASSVGGAPDGVEASCRDAASRDQPRPGTKSEGHG